MRANRSLSEQRRPVAPPSWLRGSLRGLRPFPSLFPQLLLCRRTGGLQSRSLPRAASCPGRSAALLWASSAQSKQEGGKKETGRQFHTALPPRAAQVPNKAAARGCAGVSTGPPRSPGPRPRAGRAPAAPEPRRAGHRHPERRPRGGCGGSGPGRGRSSPAAGPRSTGRGRGGRG